jgi:hypothetical protein
MRDVTYQTLAGNILSDIPAKEGKTTDIFYSVLLLKHLFHSCCCHCWWCHFCCWCPCWDWRTFLFYHLCFCAVLKIVLLTLVTNFCHRSSNDTGDKIAALLLPVVICHRYQWHHWSQCCDYRYQQQQRYTLTCEYLWVFFDKIWNVPNAIIKGQGGGEMIHEKPKAKNLVTRSL